MNKTVSEKQLAANRQNARLSTGPRTRAGRDASRANALKHGICSRELLVRGRNFREDPREFTALHDRFLQDLQPVGPLEEMLVDQIVTTHWRLRRALAAESGEIVLSVDHKDLGQTDPTACVTKWQLSLDPIPLMEQFGPGKSVARRIPQCEQQEDTKSRAALAAAVLPRAAALDRILRYETQLERQLFRAMQHLERLQLRRQAEPPSTLPASATESTPLISGNQPPPPPAN